MAAPAPSPFTGRHLLLLDFDDTLAETETHIRPAYFDYLYRRVNELRPLSRAAFTEKTAIFNKEGLGTCGWSEHLGLPESWALQLHCDIGPFMAEAVGPHMRPCPYLPGVLESLRERGFTLAILTHGHVSYVRHILPLIGMRHLFPESHIFDVTTAGGALKIAPSTYAETLGKLGIPAQQAIMVEDNPRNLIAAKALGMATIKVGTRYPHCPDRHGDVVDAAYPDALTALRALARAHTAAAA